MKIAEVVSTFPPYRGGIGNVALHNSLELQKRGHEVTVFTPQYKSIWDKKPLQLKEPENIQVKRLIPFFKYGNAGFLPQLFRKLSKFDIIHLHYPFFGGAEVIYLWLYFKKNYYRLRKKHCLLPRFIITYQMDVVGNGFLGRYFKLYTKYITPKIIGLADKIIVSSWDYAKSSSIKNILQSTPQKFVEISNGVDIDRFKPRAKDPAILARYNLTPDEKILMFVGGLDRAHYFKGVDYLIRSIKILEEQKIKLIIVGEGDLKDHYINLVKSLDLSSRIIFTGFIDEDELPKYYNLCDLFILPSIDRSEAFGLVLLEAMASGKPVIASNLPGVRSVADNYKNGYLVDMKNEGDLSNRIQSILANPELLETYGETGRKKTEEKYSWKVIGEKLDDLFSTV